MSEEGDNMNRGVDEISRMLGELTAYIHEHRHGVNNLSQKMDGLDLSVAKQLGAMKIELMTELRGIEARVVILEADRQRRLAQQSMLREVANSRLTGWVVAAVAFVVSIVKGWLHIPPLN